MSVKNKTAMAKAAKYDKLMAELKAKVECPVCLAVPSGGQMLSCPRGHLVCNSCRENMAAERQEDCPVCREPMGNNKSLLAMVVIENMEHECTNNGCKEKLSFEEVTKHKEELCMFRMIICPGIYCEQLLPFSSFNDHAKTCKKLNVATTGRLGFPLKRASHEGGREIWKTSIFQMNNETFVLRAWMEDNKVYFDTVMLAERDKSDCFMTTVSILNPKSETSFSGQFNPRPIGPTNTEESMLIVHKRSLAKVFTTNDQGEFVFTIEFKVSEKRAIEAID